MASLAFVLLLTNIVLRIPAQPDENSSAHIWQLLMLCQIPFGLGFSAAADWQARSLALLLVVQLAAAQGGKKNFSPSLQATGFNLTSMASRRAFG